MQVTGPSAVTFIPASTTLVVNAISFDMNAKVYTIGYGDLANATSGIITGVIPGAMYTALQAHAQRALEVKLGWANGSTSAT